MKTITLVALVYLPASFTAVSAPSPPVGTILKTRQTFLSTGLVHVESLAGVMHLTVSADMWFYLAITAPLMFLTLLGWWLWEFMARRRAKVTAKEHDEEG